jgi:hypothetical protein
MWNRRGSYQVGKLGRLFVKKGVQVELLEKASKELGIIWGLLLCRLER